MRRAVGMITVVQEGRFRLDCADGRSLHFTLDRHSPIEPQDLPAFRDRPVEVIYAGRFGMSGLLAHDIRRPAPAPAPPRAEPASRAVPAQLVAAPPSARR